jgi:hypothetical protein
MELHGRLIHLVTSAQQVIEGPVVSFCSNCVFSSILLLFIFSGDDHQALIWDIQQMPRAIEDPILAYTAAEGEINQIQWGATQPDWIAICYNRSLEILRV